MRRKRTHLLPADRRTIACLYRDRVPVKDICERFNCVLTTLLAAARAEGITVPRRKPNQKGIPKRKKTPDVSTTSTFQI